MINAVTLYRLTPRETDVALRMARGMKRKDIATDLRVSPETVKTFESIVFSKLAVNDRRHVADALEAQARGELYDEIL